MSFGYGKPPRVCLLNSTIVPTMAYSNGLGRNMTCRSTSPIFALTFLIFGNRIYNKQGENARAQ